MKPSLEDRFGINDLFIRYATALDSGDVEGIVSCFAEDGALESPVIGKFEGHAGIRAFSEQFAALNRRGAQLRHIMTNLAMDVDGDKARATCYLVNIITIDEQSRMGPPGRYDCQLRKIAGEWLFQNRLVVLDAPFPLPGM